MWILIRYLASRAGFSSPWWEYQHMAIRHNSQPQSGYLFSARHYLTNNYSGYSIKLWNSHKWPQTPTVALKHYSVFYNLVSWIKRPTYAAGLWSRGREATRWWQAEISLSQNYFIQQKTELLLLVVQTHIVIWGERTWCFFHLAAEEKRFLQGKCGCRRKSLWTLLKQYGPGNPPWSKNVSIINCK